MWRFRDKETKAFVSKATYNRSRAKGGTRYERVSDSRWHRGGGKPSVKPSEAPKILPLEQASPSVLSQPKTPQDFERMMEERLRKMSRRKREQFYQEEYEGPEYDTGVDY